MAADVETSFLWLGLVEESPDAVVAVSLAGEVWLWNRRAEAMYGIARADALAKPLAELIAPSHLRDEARNLLARAADAGHATLAVTTHRRDTGELVAVEVTARLVHTAAGEPAFIAITGRDVTRAHAAHRHDRELLASIGHELRSPLNAIIGFSELMHGGKVGALADDHKEYLGDILHSARHLMQLLNDVLELARLEPANLVFRPELVELAQAVGAVCDLLRGLATKKHIRVRTEIDPAVARAILDPAKLKHVIYHLLSNTLKLAPEQGHVIIRLAPSHGGRFSIEVEGSGVGIRAADLDREHGLALTKRIVEAQGGRVIVRGDSDAGSVVSASLPLRVP